MEPRERTDRVNERLVLTQRMAGLTFGTDALLLAAYVRRGEQSRALELGGGSAIVSLLLAAREKVRSIECVEIQSAYAELALKNVRENGLEDRITVICADIRNPADYGKEPFDLVLANPPYMTCDVPPCEEEEKQIARHEVCGGIREFARAAGTKLRWGGSFFCVYRPDRLADLTEAVRDAGMEIKRMTFVHATPALSPSTVLIEAKRGGKPGMKVTKPLFIGGSLTERADSPDMVYILEKGRFPKAYD